MISLLFLSNQLLLGGTTGLLEGRIIDKATREPLPAANVLIIGTSFGAASDADGVFHINNIRAGIYDLRFSMVGYRTVIMRKVTILPDLRTRIDVEMEQSVIEIDVVEVRAEKPLIQKDRAATAFAISEAKIERLPISQFSEVLSLQPGTTLEGNVRGGKTSEVIYFIDGLPVQDVIGGGLGTHLPRSSITGLTVHTGGFDAEYGNAMSGVVNVITKGGGNTQSLSVRYERDNWIPEKWYRQKDRYSEIDLTAGGPLIPEKLFYFTANNVTLTDTRWWQDLERFFDSPIDKHFNGFAKLEYHFMPAIRVSAQALYSLRSWRDYEYSWRFYLPGLPDRTRNSFRLASSFSHTLTDYSFYTLSLSAFDLRSKIGSGSKDALDLKPYEYDFFLRYILSGDRNWWSDTKQTIYTLKGDYTHHFAKTHLVKVGFQVDQYNIVSDLVKYEPQTTYFGKPRVDAPMLNYSNSFSYHPRTGSIYIQDKVELIQDGSNLSVGLRWDFLDPTAERPIVEYIPTRPNEYEQQITGKVKANIKHQISPRISVAAPVGPASFFFVNFGHYFQNPLFDYLYSGLHPAILKSGAKNVSSGNPDLEPERSIAWEIGFKHGINEDVVASITYFRKTFRNQIDSKTLIPFDSKYSGDYGFSNYVNNAEANASGIEFFLYREGDERLTGSVSYSYMITEGISEYVGQRVNYEQWGFPLVSQPFPLSWDQRHTVKLDTDFALFDGINTNVVALYNSPRPYTYFPTRDGFVPLDTNKILVPNNKRMEHFFLVNVKLSKSFRMFNDRCRIMIFVDVRNLFNWQNVRWIDSNGRIGGELEDPGAYYDPRRVRVGLKVDL